MSFTKLKAKALRLRPAKSTRLANKLTRTLDKDDATSLTLTDLDRRAEELRLGRVKSIPAEKVISDARSKLVTSLQ